MKISNLYILLLAALAIVACDPNKDIYKEMEANPAPITSDLEFTMTSDDYKLSGNENAAKYGSFSNIDDAKAGIPVVLSSKYPQLGKGSSAKVGYKLYVGSPEGLSNYTYAEDYKVSATDYYTVSTEAGDAGFFNNEKKAGDYIPGILAANIASPADGDKVSVNYEYAEINYADISGVVVFSEDFQSYTVPDLGTLQTFSVAGAETWVSYSSSSGYQAARMSGYAGGNQPNEDWLILPQIDLTGFSNAEFKLNQVVNFLATGVTGTDLAVKVSTDYDGVDPSTATWTDLALDKWPAGDSYDAVDSKASLAAYADMQIYIAFYYKSTVDYAPQWRLISTSVEEGEAIATDSRNHFYDYDAGSTSWVAAGSEVYYLSSSDYDAMGSPGKYNNFSSSDPASNYLPTLLSIMYPFAQDGQQLFVIYKYYSSSAGAVQTRGDLYTYSGTWDYAPSTIETVMQLGMNGTVWEPDNTIKYTMTGDDYTYVVAEYADVNPAGAASMATYGNYDITIWSSGEIQSSITDVLLKNFPSAAEAQKYLVSYRVYTGSAGDTYTIHLIKEGDTYVVVGE